MTNAPSHNRPSGDQPPPSGAGRPQAGHRLGLRLAEYLIGRACRRLPGDARDERCREWTAELPAILHDPAVRSPWRRTARALFFAAGISRTTRRLRRARGHSPIRRRLIAGLVIYLTLLAAFIWYGQAFPTDGFPSAVAVILVSGAGFVLFCLTDLARAKEVRYLPKWGWAIACLVQVPLGGILYLAAGRTYGDKR
jgi:hypothetical protein